MYKGFIKAELQRFAVTNTLPADFERMKTLFMTRLLDRGFPAHQLQRWFDAVDHSCRIALLSRPPGSRQQRRSDAPVLVLPNGQFEMTARIGVVLNRVYAQYKHHPEVSRVFCGPAAHLVVAYTKNKSIASRLIRARH
jgi:hypothetical protein